MIKKNLDLIILGFLLIAIILFEETFEIVEELLHLTLEVLHTMFEWVELGVEDVVDKLFEHLEAPETIKFLFITERHGSQVITFYFLMSVIVFILSKLVKFLPGIGRFFKRLVLMAWIRRKTEFQLYWRTLNKLNKAALLASAVGFLVLASLIII